MPYAMGYRDEKTEKLVCEIFPDWQTMFKRFESIDSISKTVYEIVQGPNDSETS